MSKRLPVTFPDNRYEILKKIASDSGKSMSEIINQFVKILEHIEKMPEIIICSDSEKPSKTIVLIDGEALKYVKSVKFNHDVADTYPDYEIEIFKTTEDGRVLVDESKMSIIMETLKPKIFNKGGNKNA